MAKSRELGGLGFGYLELFGFEDEASAFVEAKAALGGGAAQACRYLATAWARERTRSLV